MGSVFHHHGDVPPVPFANCLSTDMIGATSATLCPSQIIQKQLVVQKVTVYHLDSNFMKTASVREMLASYVSSLVVNRLVAADEKLTEPASERMLAAVMFTDISGFSTLAERLSQLGPSGAEELSIALNAYFGQLVDIVVAHEGDVVKFSGDGMFAIWRAADEERLGRATATAAQCALRVQEVLFNYQVAEDMRLSMRVGVSAGEIGIFHVGGIYNRWEFMTVGAPVAQGATASDVARSGEVVLSPAAWPHVASLAIGQQFQNGYVLLQHLDAVDPLIQDARDTLLQLPESLLQSYVPGAIWARLSAGQSGWMAELRRVCVLFVNLPDFGQVTDDELALAQEMMRTFQATIYRYEGSINKLNVDDKGITLVTALGLPPLAHEDDPERGIRVALDVRRELRERGLRGAIGVATGQVFCGSVGNEIRREYTMLGDTVNLSARLMQLAARTEGVDEVPLLCDETTYQASIGELEFVALPPALLKGKSEPVKVFQPQGQKARRDGRAPISQGAMVGRENERQLLSTQFKRFLEGEQVPTTVIVGEAGIGKTRLVDEFRRQVETYGITVFTGQGDAIETSTSYHAWRGVFSQMLDLAVMTDIDARRRHVLDLLEMEEDILDLAPLLNGVLLLDLPDNETTKQMSGQVRADNTQKLLLQLLQDSVSRSPKIIILEDAHWMDSASWGLLSLVRQRLRQVMIVLANRPMAERPPEYRQIVHHPDTSYIALDELSAEDTSSLISQTLGVRELPEPMVALVLQKAEGHPLYSEQMVYALRDAGILVIEDGVCRINAKARGMESFDLPDTLHGLIISRIDRLTPEQQLTLKVASVIGRTFSFQTLSDVYPFDSDNLHTHLNRLEELDITMVQMPEPDLTYMFKHIVMQEVIYNLMLFTQRRQLHRAVAQWYERSYRDDLGSFYPLLAYHWGKAEEREKTIAYLERAGSQALHDYSNQEAVRFFKEAFEWYQDRKEVDQNRVGKRPRSALRQARWARQLGQAYLNMGELGESRRHLHRALEFLGDYWPVQRGEQIYRLVGQGVRQSWYLLRPPNSDQYDKETRQWMFELTHVYELLAEIHFLSNDSVFTLYAVMRNLNFANRVGPSAELARAYALASALTVPPWLDWLITLYARRAVATARTADHQATTARVLALTSLRRITRGQWAKAEAALVKSIAICQRLDDQRQLQEGHTFLAWVAYRRGEFARSLALYRGVYESANRRDDMLRKAWGLDGQALNLLALGRNGKAAELLTQSIKILEESHDVAEYLNACAMHVRLALRAEEWTAAWEYGQIIRTYLDDSAPLVYSTIQAYTAVAELALTSWEQDIPLIAGASGWPQVAKEAVDRLGWFAYLLPAEKARAALVKGWYHWLNGRRYRARRTWQKGIQEAKRLRMPYEEALLYYHMGRLLPAADAQRDGHLQQALDIFVSLDASYEIQQTKSVIGT